MVDAIKNATIKINRYAFNLTNYRHQGYLMDFLLLERALRFMTLYLYFLLLDDASLATINVRLTVGSEFHYRSQAKDG